MLRELARGVHGLGLLERAGEVCAAEAWPVLFERLLHSAVAAREIARQQLRRRRGDDERNFIPRAKVADGGGRRIDGRGEPLCATITAPAHAGAVVEHDDDRTGEPVEPRRCASDLAAEKGLREGQRQREEGEDAGSEQQPLLELGCGRGLPLGGSQKPDGREPLAHRLLAVHKVDGDRHGHTEEAEQEQRLEEAHG